MDTHGLGQRDPSRPPAAMPKHPSVRRLPAYVPDQPNAVGVVALVDRHARPLFFGPHGLDGEMGSKGPLAAVMDDARRGADIRIGERGDVLLQKVDEAPFALQEG